MASSWLDIHQNQGSAWEGADAYSYCSPHAAKALYSLVLVVAASKMTEMHQLVAVADGLVALSYSPTLHMSSFSPQHLHLLYSQRSLVFQICRIEQHPLKEAEDDLCEIREVLGEEPIVSQHLPKDYLVRQMHLDIPFYSHLFEFYLHRISHARSDL